MTLMDSGLEATAAKLVTEDGSVKYNCDNAHESSEGEPSQTSTAAPRSRIHL